MNTIGSRIRELRKALNNGRGIKQSEFAEKLGVQHSTVSLWERDININDKTVKAICYTFKVSEQWLKNGFGEMSLSIRDKDEIVLEKFRCLSPEVQDLVLNYMDILLKNQNVLMDSIEEELPFSAREDTITTSVKNPDITIKKRPCPAENEAGGAAG
jgi:transcriptional regulator with XRE-family HTH domain